MGSFTLALLEALLSAGVSHERARAFVDLFDRSIDERYGLHAQILATKHDVAEHAAATSRQVTELQASTGKDINDLRASTSRDFHELREGTSRDINELRTATTRALAELETRLTRDIARTQAGIAESKADLVKWSLAALTAQTALLFGAMKLL